MEDQGLQVVPEHAQSHPEHCRVAEDQAESGEAHDTAVHW